MSHVMRKPDMPYANNKDADPPGRKPRRQVFSWCGSNEKSRMCHNHMSQNREIPDSQNYKQNDPRHDKTNKMSVRPAKTQISLGNRPVWSESSLCAQWITKDPSFLHADSDYSDQTGRMPRLIWVFAGRTLTLLVLSCRGSYVAAKRKTRLTKRHAKHHNIVSTQRTFNALITLRGMFRRLLWVLEVSIMASTGFLRTWIKRSTFSSDV